ncbi:MAG: cob(I)yrinic acid a,c-diamide adenosyltransferase [bacterium]
MSLKHPAEREGMIHVYTGDGKGKTTAALGLALRAAGHDMKVCFIQFMKGWAYGEVASARHLPDFTLLQFGRADFVNPDEPSPQDKELAQRALNKAREVMASGSYDLLVLDEVNVAVGYGLITLASLLEILDQKPPSLELVLTGRGAGPEIIKRADLVTEMKEIKHYYSTRSLPARKGIEY